MVVAQPDLSLLNGRWPDWEVSSWTGFNLVLIADFDLSYHHAVEVRFTEVGYVSSPAAFHDPTFRPHTAGEFEAVVALLDGERDFTLYVWDVEGHACMVAAQAAEVHEALVAH